MNLDQFSIVAARFMSWMAEIQIRSLVLLALTGIVVYFLRHSSAAMRHLALSLTILGLLALPLLSLCLPSWMAHPPAVSHAKTVAGDSEPGRAIVRSVPNESRRKTPLKPTALQEPTPAYLAAASRIDDRSPVWQTDLFVHLLPTMTVLVLLVWLIGALALLLRIGIGLFRLSRTSQMVSSTATVASILDGELSALSSSLGLRRTIRLIVGPPETLGLSPMTWGLCRPVILLPAESEGWQPARLRSVLLHELAHIQRGDWATDLLVGVVCALYWFNPLVWLLARRIRSESECACDDRVLLAGVTPVDYAGHLVEVARNLKARHFAVSAVVTMTHHSDVGNRVRAILSAHQPRIPASVRVVVLALIGVFILLLPLASIRIAAAGGQETSAEANPLRLGGVTYYNDAIPPMTHLMARMKPNIKLSPEMSRAFAALRFAHGSDRFPNGVIAEGLSVTAMEPNGSIKSWERTGNLLMHAPNGWSGSGLNAGEFRYEVSLNLPGSAGWIDKTTLDRLTKANDFVSAFGVVGSPDTHLRQPGATDYGNGYFKINDSYTWKPGRSTPGQPLPAKVDVYLTTGYGPWQTVGEIGRNSVSGPWVTVPGSGDITALSPLVTRRGGVEVETVATVSDRFTARDVNGRPQWSLRLETMDATGHPIGKPRIAQYQQTSDESPDDGKTGILFRFLTSELPFEKVASVRLQVRPLQTIYFRNVPTRSTESPKNPAGTR